jgi:hypothetical protein
MHVFLVLHLIFFPTILVGIHAYIICMLMIQQKLLILQMLMKSKTHLINKDLDFLYGWLQANGLSLI